MGRKGTPATADERQLAMFELPPTQPTPTYDMEQARQKRKAAIRRVEQNADPAWRERAYAAVVRVAAKKGEFIVDDVWDELGEDDQPKTASAMGPVLLRAMRAGVIWGSTEVAYSARTSTHSSRRIWLSNRKAVAA